MVELASVIERSVNECLEDRVGVAFSGGLDSATIAKVAKESAEVELLSVGVRGSEDVTYSEIVARELGLPLHARILSREEVVGYYHKAMEILNADFLKVEIMAPIYVVAEEAEKRGIEVVLFGSGSEELFVGYERYYTYWSEGKDLDGILRGEFESLRNRDIAMIKRVMKKHGVEARFPFYSRELADCVFSTPLAMRMEERELKKGMLREAAHFLGVPGTAVKRKKKALQYGSGVHKILLREVGGRKGSLGGA
jgi:asparagine synthase (glutamine-hydrolysing)